MNHFPPFLFLRIAKWNSLLTEDYMQNPLKLGEISDLVDCGDHHQHGSISNLDNSSGGKLIVRFDLFPKNHRTICFIFCCRTGHI